MHVGKLEFDERRHPRLLFAQEVSHGHRESLGQAGV
jgi:hypothetical protein